MACFRALSNCFLILAFLVLAAPVPARAAIDAKGAEQLRGVVQVMIDRYRNAASDKGGQLTLDGDIIIEPTGSYYAVTLPAMKYGAPDGRRTEIGMIAINAMPAAAPGEWKMTVALPSPLSHYDGKNRLYALTTIGAQNFAGIWSEKMKAFIKLDATYKDIKGLTPEHKPFLNVANASMNGDFKDNGQGQWSGTLLMDATGITFGDAQAKHGKIDRIALRSAIKDYNLDNILDYDQKISALTENYQAGDGGEMSLPHVMALYNLISDFVTSALDALDVTVSIEGLDVTRPAIAGQPAGHLALKSGTGGFSLSGLRANNASLGLKLAYDGLQMSPMPENIKAHSLPDHAHIDISLNNLPVRELLDQGKTSLQMTVDAPNEAVAQMALISLVAQAPQLLTQSHANLAIRDSEIGNDEWLVALNTLITADLKAQLSATGTSTLKVTGLEKIIADLQEKQKDPNLTPEQKAKIEDGLQKLTVLQLASTKQQGADGRTVHVFNFELGQDGKVMLNGTDLSTLMPQ
jgi:hypothetical protein